MEKCKNADKYKGMIAPTCGCDACRIKYLENCIVRVEQAGLLVMTAQQLEDSITNVAEAYAPDVVKFVDLADAIHVNYHSEFAQIDECADTKSESDHAVTMAAVVDSTIKLAKDNGCSIESLIKALDQSLGYV